MGRYLLHRVSLWIPQELRHKMSMSKLLGFWSCRIICDYVRWQKSENALHYLEFSLLILPNFHKFSNEKSTVLFVNSK
jgi:hypothetical protein